MSLYFPSSTRAIQSSGRRLSLIGLSLSLLVIGAWVGWFFLGTITLYQTSDLLKIDRVSLLETPLVAATFPASAFAFIQQGQDAYLWIDNDTNNTTPLLVQIYDIETTDENQPIHTTIWIKSPSSLASLPPGNLFGRVKIPTKHIKPIGLFLHEIGEVDESSTDQQYAVSWCEQE
jgi:hypothetical protein